MVRTASLLTLYSLADRDDGQKTSPLPPTSQPSACNPVNFGDSPKRQTAGGTWTVETNDESTFRLPRPESLPAARLDKN
jgi:hypothetical protein